jgi:hypothetical protein
MSDTLHISSGFHSPRSFDGDSWSDTELKSTESSESFYSPMYVMSSNKGTDTPDDSYLKAFELHVNEETIREKEQDDILKARHAALMACMKAVTTSSLETSQLIEQGTQWIEHSKCAGKASACLRKKRKRLDTMELAAREKDIERPYQVENMSIG